MISYKMKQKKQLKQCAEESLLHKLSSSIKSTGIVVFKNAGNYEDMKRLVIDKSLQISCLMFFFCCLIG